MARTADKRVSRSTAQREEEEESGSDSEVHGRQGVFQTVDGEPICFMFHTSLSPGQQRKLEQMITEHGGMVMETEDEVDTVIVSGVYHSANFKRMQRQYGCSKYPVKRKIHVERPSFIRTCISQNRFFHRVPPKRGLGGPRRTRSTRVPFTDDDDYNLAQYIASRRPEKASGGRSGNSLYKELVDLAPSDEEHPAEYAWTRRHTWHSWRERYVRKKQHMDPIIDEFVAALPPQETVVDPRDCRIRRKARRSSRASDDSRSRTSDDNSGSQSEDSELDYAENESLPNLPHRTGAGNARQPRREEVENRGDTHERQKEEPPRSAKMRLKKQEKGKGRADPPLRDLEDSDNNSLFDGEINMIVIDGPGPSGTQHQSSPRPTQASQRTLVEANRSQSHKAPPPQLNSRGSEARTSNPVSHAEDRKAVGVNGSPTPLARPRFSQKSVDVSVHKSKSSAKGAKSVRRKVAAILSTVDDNALYRKTRLRSREPASLAAKKTTRPRQLKHTFVSPVIEDFIAEEASVHALAPMGETVEEQNVVDQLFANDHSTLGEDETVGMSHKLQSKRLDSDDQQTHNALRSSVEIPSDEEELSESRVLSTMLQANSFLRRSSHGRRQINPASRNLHHNQETTGQIFTPNRKKRHSGSSTNSYPSPGTRAFKMKNRLETHEKRTLYVPPPGTRAAALKK